MAVNLECLIDTLSRNVRVLPQPIVSVSSDVINITSGDSARLSATGALNYLWSPSSGLSCSSCPAPSAAPSGTTTYVLTGTNAQGCAASDSITIRVDIKCNEFFIPDIFSPNGTGNLVNEKLCAYSNCIRLFSFIIYNRWGEQVFETTDIAACWDGTYKGKESPSGIYAFKLYAEQIDGTIVDKKGTITLVR
jgi:gliding motility-associated-like protein